MTVNSDELEVIVRPENCVGCRICQLRCSLAHAGIFAPTKARIVVQRDFRRHGFSISFKDDCVRCGLCADFCVYGALLKR
ncbi:MAG TPA: hypothetical protein ENF26_05380 [Methanomicrobia archaeon]|nr:hypothetical protein [Methanomicrobia archaeon]HEX59559.1 hypothetical protein [Methanomicrobia archaeon]